MLDPPPLPARLSRVSTVVGVGTLLWIVATVVLVVVGLSGVAVAPLAMTTCLVGVALGGIGWAIFAWQRSAARRGSRTAQQGLDA